MNRLSLWLYRFWYSHANGACTERSNSVCGVGFDRNAQTSQNSTHISRTIPFKSAFGLLLLAFLAACANTSTPPAPLSSNPETVMRQLFVPAKGVDANVLNNIAETNRAEFVPVLIELLRFRESHNVGIGAALHKLTGQTFGDDWSAWVEWLGTQNIPTPQGFDAWKGDLLAEIDENFRDFIHHDTTTRINLAEIVWGGVQKDGIPALVNPKFIVAHEASYLDDQDLVFGLAINGDIRAYPHRILDWHEMANDVVGGVPIALTY